MMTMIQSLVAGLINMIMSIINTIMGCNVTVHISGIEVDFPQGAEKSNALASVTAKAVSKASRSYYSNSRIMSIASMQDWFDRCPDVSYYIILDAGVTLHVGKAALTALHHSVQVILTKMDDSMLVYVVPQKDDAGKLLVTNVKDRRYKIRYSTGDNKTAGYIECRGLTAGPRYTGCGINRTCYSRGVARICPK